MSNRIIEGEPGTRWRNDTDQVWYQLIVSWQNSCGRCAQFDHMIAPSWPIPFHRNCRCAQIPLYPGRTSRPFADFRRKVARLNRAQRERVMGRAALRLVESRLVEWRDVVTPDRIRDLHEVVLLRKLSVEAMVNNGVDPGVAERAFARARGTLAELEAKRRRDRVERMARRADEESVRRRETADRVAAVAALAGLAGLAGLALAEWVWDDVGALRDYLKSAGVKQSVIDAIAPESALAPES